MRSVPVLMYHHVNPHQGDTVTVTPEVFEAQMDHLRESGYRTLTAVELFGYINGELTLKQKAVAITFDDGWIDNYLYAFPVLKKNHFNATVFIITDRVEKASGKMSSLPEYIPTHNESKVLIETGEAHRVALNWKLIEEVTAGGLVEFYSHTKSHRKCDTLSEHQLREELGGSREMIEKRLGRACPFLCWPYGQYTPGAVQVAKEVGYGALYTTDHGVVKAGSDPFAIKRIEVKDGRKWFEKRMFLYTNPILSLLSPALNKD
jgi:peptidoglycan/xylan/chitin deacetylase (PgdA/CDA1 family)